MNVRTDLALEAHKISGEMRGIVSETETKGTLRISRTRILSRKASERLGKPCGSYITLEGLPLSDSYRDVKEQISVISDEIAALVPENGTVLVIGIGNTEITPDSLGPKSADAVIATRHIHGEIAKSAGLDRLRPVAVLSPGVLGQTGIEAGEVILSLAKTIQPSAVIAIDALASAGLAHLVRTIQISDSGIIPGSGVGNHRMRLCRETVGVPVIAVGMPTVVDGTTLALELLGDRNGKEPVTADQKSLMVTPREIDILTERASKLIGMSVNCALQREYSFDELALLIS